MTLSIRDTMHFGKYKGTNVGKMMLEDAGYCCWLREEKKKADPRDMAFDVEANAMIDVAISCSKTLKKKYAPWNQPKPPGPVPESKDVPKTVAPESPVVEKIKESKDWIAKVIAEAKAQKEKDLAKFEATGGAKLEVTMLPTMGEIKDAMARSGALSGSAATAIAIDAMDALIFHGRPPPVKAAPKDAPVREVEHAGDWGSW